MRAKQLLHSFLVFMAMIMPLQSWSQNYDEEIVGTVHANRLGKSITLTVPDEWQDYYNSHYGSGGYTWQTVGSGVSLEYAVYPKRAQRSIKVDISKLSSGAQVWCSFSYYLGGQYGTPWYTKLIWYIKPPIYVESVSLNYTSLTLGVGKTQQLTATIIPSDAEISTVQWSSSNESIATVDRNGLVTAKADGNATITCKPSDQAKNPAPATCSVTVTAPIAISAENFPDTNFRKYILEQSYGKDGVLTPEEIDKVTYINVRGSYSKPGVISSLKGIEYFTALESLLCEYNQLTALDVSKNTDLTYLTCGGNQLTALDVSKNTALTILSCYMNQLTALDVSKNTALTSLSCSMNQLTTLDVSKNTALTSLSCYMNQLTAMDVSKNTALTSLDCQYNQLTALDVSKNTALTSLSCSKNQLTALDVSKNIALTSLDCKYNQLTTLDVSKNTALTSLSCFNNQLTALDVSKNTALTGLSCYNNQLTALDVSRNTALTTLYCSDNQLTTLDVSKNTALTSLSCSNNLLTTLDVSKNTKLTDLRCGGNQIKGSAMDNLIMSLPTNQTDKEYLFEVIYTNREEGNVCTEAQVAAAKTKGWTPKAWNGDEWVDYEGSEEIIEVISISLPTEATVVSGETVTLTPNINPTNATTALIWSSDDETVATVNQNGVVTGVKKGRTFINVETDNGKTAYCKLAVTAAEPVSIELPKNATVYVGGTLTLTPTITPEDAETTLTWKSDDESVARIDANGVLTGVAEGLALVTVSTSNGLTSNACKVKVELDPSGICTVMIREKAEVPVYSTSGQRLVAPRKGINIVGGKKVIVK